MNVAVVVVAHVKELGQTPGEILGERAYIFIMGADVQDLIGLVNLAIDHLGHGLGPRHLKLKLFPAHGLNKDREVQLTPASHNEYVRTRGRFDLQADVGTQLPEEPITEVAGGAVFSFLSHEWGGAHSESHPNCRLFYVDGR